MWEEQCKLQTSKKCGERYHPAVIRPNGIQYHTMPRARDRQPRCKFPLRNSPQANREDTTQLKCRTSNKIRKEEAKKKKQVLSESESVLYYTQDHKDGSLQEPVASFQPAITNLVPPSKCPVEMISMF
ncbi:unnamed protein product [Clavelina lepadiformis]|uniref:Uncharacterized protein n=1 Tax=Clavelina lepadiformis TaxID=159417 RepID=A0ABP0GDL5_CLALP